MTLIDEHLGLLYWTCNNFSRRFNIDADDCLAQAYIYARELEPKWDSKRSKFSTYICQFVYMRLMKWYYKTQRPVMNRLTTPTEDISSVPIEDERDHPQDDGTYNEVDFRDEFDTYWREILSIASPRDAEMVKQYYLEGRTLAQVGKMNRMSKQRVKQVHSAIFKKINDRLENKIRK